MSLRVIHGDDPDYTIDKFLGAGGFGAVFKVRRKLDGQVLACKTMNLEGENHVEMIVREVAAMRALAGCRNVVQWMPDVVLDKEDMMIRLHMQYYPDGDLGDLIRSYGQSPVPKDTATQVFCCLAMALLDCHSRGMCHRDIKPANVLVSRKIWNGQPMTIAYLADFGLVARSKVALTSGFTIEGLGNGGTENYMAPETIDRHTASFSERSDLFSLGCTMYKVFNRQEAYEDYERIRVPAMTPAAVSEYGGRLCPLVTSLMQLLPARRPGTQQLVSSLEAYCVSRWEKQKATMMWESLAVVSRTNDGPVIAPRPPWEQQLPERREPFQLPSELENLQPPPQYQQQQQPQQRMPILPPALQRARQARQAQQQRVATLQQIQMQSARQEQQRQQLQQQQFGAPGNVTRP